MVLKPPAHLRTIALERAALRRAIAQGSRVSPQSFAHSVPWPTCRETDGSRCVLKKNERSPVDILRHDRFG